METLVPEMRGLIAAGRYLRAVQCARLRGLTTSTAFTMAREIQAGARWYRPALYPSPKVKTRRA